MAQQPTLDYRTLPARSGAAPYPLLVLLHGRGADELDLLGLGPELDPRFFVASIRAPYSWSGMGGYCWYEGEQGDPRQATTLRESLGRLEQTIRHIADTQSVDREQLYLLGFSQGAMMSYSLATTSPELVTGAILLSGFRPPIDLPVAGNGTLAGKPMFIGHGTMDPLVSTARGQAMRDTLTGLGAEVEYHEYDMAHQINGPELADFRAWLARRLESPPAGR